MQDKNKDLVLLHQSVKNVSEHLEIKDIRKEVWNDFISRVEQGMLPHNYYNKKYGFINWITIQKYMQVYMDEWDVDELMCAMAKARDDFINLARDAAKGNFSRVNVSIYSKLFEVFFPKRDKKDEMDVQDGITKLQETRDKLNEAARGDVPLKKKIDGERKQRVNAFLNTYKSYHSV